MPDSGTSSEVALDQAKLAASRLWACNRWPYLARAILALTPIAAPGLNRYAIDEAWRVYLDPMVVDRCSPSQLGFVLNHVAQHLLRDHAGRARRFGVSFEERLSWNAAADIEINGELAREISRKDRTVLAPLTAKQLDLQPGMLAEYYYTRLRHSNPLVPDEGPGVHGHGGQSDEPGGDGETSSTAENDTTGGPGQAGQPGSGEQPAEGDGRSVSAVDAEMLREAVAEELLGEGAGTVPAGLTRWAQERRGASQDWRALLASSLRSHANRAAGLTDYSYRRLSRRAGAVPDVVLPAMVNAPVHMAIVIDTSASMRAAELADALRETRVIVEGVTAGGGSVQILACDATATRLASTTSATAVALTGGGGTNMATGIEAAIDESPRPQSVVVLTDGQTPWPKVEPVVPVIIGLIGRRRKVTTPDWATTIEIITGGGGR